MFGDYAVAFIDCERETVIEYAEGDGEFSNLRWLNAPVSFWPFPVNEAARMETARGQFRRESLVGHWRYCCFECKVGEDLSSLINVVKNGSLPLIWAAALNEETLHMMVMVDAGDWKKWEHRGREISAQLDGFGVKAVPLPFDSDILLPGSFKATELLYFNPDICQDLFEMLSAGDRRRLTSLMGPAC